MATDVGEKGQLIGDLIGEGMYAEVRLASPCTVLKTLRPYRFANAVAVQEAFRREVFGSMLLSDLDIGPTLVAVHLDKLGVELELLHGQTLTYLDKPKAKRKAIAKAARLLARLHVVGYTHNDLHKHCNVFVQDDGQVKLLDGGMVARPGEPLCDGRLALPANLDLLSLLTGIRHD